MPISTPTPIALEVVLIEANSFQILGFEVHTDTDNEDRMIVRKEARQVTDDVIVSRTPLRVTEYDAVSMLPLLADIATRLTTAFGLQLPAVGDQAIGYALYCALRDGLYEAERRSGEFPADAT